MADRQLKQINKSYFIERAENKNKCFEDVCTVLCWQKAATSAFEQVTFINNFRIL